MSCMTFSAFSASLVFLLQLTSIPAAASAFWVSSALPEIHRACGGLPESAHLPLAREGLTPHPPNMLSLIAAVLQTAPGQCISLTQLPAFQ
ncbi:hypothetical protein MLD38_025829 [Melastoma candidum]|uniref:Uncharacterized protein n=1 Tax=Melastoma candidum TaxID=119954 RepID=A0ACB9NY06_9MYRT|nr:hypothetical protein MLD38_025829 [Melastoma candidum]